MIGRIMLHKNTLLFAALSAALWGSATQAANAAVVASLKPLGFIASAIADGVTDTEVLLPDGASEHDYSLRPSDVKRLQGADLVVWIGPEMEAFMEKSVKNIPNAKQVTIAQLNDVKPLLMKGADDDDDDHGHDDAGSEKSDEHHHHGDYNMHLWLSPEIARASAVAIHDKLVELMPQSRAKLDANLKQKATCVFAEPQFRPAVVEAVARGTSVRMGTLDPLGTNIKLGKTSYSAFLNQLANQYASCLKGD